MRVFSVMALLTLALGCSGMRNVAMKTGNLDGTWVPISEEIAGTAIPAAAFEKQVLTINAGTYTLVAESVDKGELKYADGKMDIFGKEGVNNGKHFTAIYELKGEQLKICYNLAGDSYPEAFDTKGKPMFFLAVFQRQ